MYKQNFKKVEVIIIETKKIRTKNNQLNTLATSENQGYD